MILPHCSESDHNLYHHTATAASQTSGHSSGSGISRRIIKTSSACGARCRSMLGYQPQLHLQLFSESDTMSRNSYNDADSSGVHYSQQPNDMFLHHHGKIAIKKNTGYNDSTNCCLPPPSPAPNSDRYIMGVASPKTAKACSATSNANCLELHTLYTKYNDGGANGNGQPHKPNAQHQHQQQHQDIHNISHSLSSYISTSPLAVYSNCDTNLTQKYVNSMSQCSNLPNTRFRLSDRYREVPTSKSLLLNMPSNVECQNTNASASGAVTSQPSSTARYVSSAHFLTQNTPLVTSDSYTYLSSTVHTPVKRYVPTPPPQNEFYTDIPMQLSPVQTTTSQSLNKNIGTNNGGHVLTNHANTLPYRFRMKCCINESINPTVIQPTNTNISHLTHNLEHRPLPATEYCTPSPRSRPTYANSSNGVYSSSGCYSSIIGNNNANVIISSKCTTATEKDSSIIILHDQQIQTTGQLASTKAHEGNASLSSPSVAASGAGSLRGRALTASPITITGNNCNSMYVVGANQINAISVARANNTSVINDFIQGSPSIEYINTSATTIGPTSSHLSMTPLRQMESNFNSGVDSSSSTSPSMGGAKTCLHCNTVRRTTGVHQTTQTTGPISPIPLQQVIDGVSNVVVGISSCSNGSFLPNALDQSSPTLTPSTSESHISPLSPPADGPNYSRTLFPNKKDDINIRGIEQLQQPQGEHMYIVQKPQQETKNVVTQGTITEHNGAVASMSTSGQSHQHQVVGRHLTKQQPIQAQQQYILKPQQLSPIQQPPMHKQQQKIHLSCKKRFSQYVRQEIARFFGVDPSTEAGEFAVWQGRQRRLALRRFGALKSESELHAEMTNDNPLEGYNGENGYSSAVRINQQYQQHYHNHSERPDILPTHDTKDSHLEIKYSTRGRQFLYADFQIGDNVERKASVATMIMSSLTVIGHNLNKRQPRYNRQWSRSFAPAHISAIDNSGDVFEGLSALQEEELFFDSAGPDQAVGSGSLSGNNNGNNTASGNLQQAITTCSVIRNSGSTMPVSNSLEMIEHHRQIYIGERMNGWRTSSVLPGTTHSITNNDQIGLQQASNRGGGASAQNQSNDCGVRGNSRQPQNATVAGQVATSSPPNTQPTNGTRGNRISAQLLDGVLENSRRPIKRKVRLFSVNDLDDRADHRPFFTYWINTVQILVLLLSLICYGIGPIGIGIEQKTGQVLVTSLSLQTVQHREQRNVWIGPRNNDLVHMGAKFATCMRSDLRITDVLLKMRRQERETACCIRNDDSGCVQSSQADCSVRGLFPTKSISTWKKWSPGESGPGGRISGSVCGLDPKYCDAPASIAPYEWPDDITKWPICRKTNSFSQRFRYKDHTAEHMSCEVIGHPCCTGVYGECYITTREYCDFVNGYFHEEASLCSQVSCLNNVCGMLPFFSVEVPDQFYRLFTSLCLHAGIIHLAMTIAFQHVFLADLERLIGPIRTAILYIGSGLAGNLTSAVLVPYKPEVGPLASLSGVIASQAVLLVLIHWKHLRKPHIALFKLLCTEALLFGIGTLPWQLNFAGLLAGILCGIILTIALVPFVSITKYGRNAKINLIWSCVIFHLFIYSLLLVIFYVFPSQLTSLNVEEVLGTNFNSNWGSHSNVADSVSVGVGVGGIGLGSTRTASGSDTLRVVSQENEQSANAGGKDNRYLPMLHQYHYHHRSNDILAKETHMSKGSLQQQQRDMEPATSFYHYAYNVNRNNNQMRGKNNYNNNNNNSFANYYYTDDIKNFTNSSKAQYADISDDKTLAEKIKRNCKYACNNANHHGNVLEVIGAEAVIRNTDNDINITDYNNGNKRKSAENVNLNVNININVERSDFKYDERQVKQSPPTTAQQQKLSDRSGRSPPNKKLRSGAFSSFENHLQKQQQKKHTIFTNFIESNKIDNIESNSAVFRRVHPPSNLYPTSGPQPTNKLTDILDTSHASGELEDTDDIDGEVLYIVKTDAESVAVGKQQSNEMLLVNVYVHDVKDQLNGYSILKNLSDHKYDHVANIVNDNNDGTDSPTITANYRKVVQKKPSSLQLPNDNLHRHYTRVTLTNTKAAVPIMRNTYSESMISAALIKARRKMYITQSKWFSPSLETVAEAPHKQIAGSGQKR